MLTITVPANELFDERTSEFISVKEHVLLLEHSLLSLSKWESKWHKSFLFSLENGTLSLEETIDYIRCMCLTKNVDPNVYKCLSPSNISEINEYLSNPMTATTISDNQPGERNYEIKTSELIYYWMIACGIPFECEKWHLNRLIMLIRVCSAKNSPPRKMSRDEIMRRNAELNAKRRKEWNSKG